MREERRFDFDGANAVSGNVHDFIRPPGKPDVAVFIEMGGVACEIDALTGDAFPIVAVVAIVFPPKRGCQPREGVLDGQNAFFVGRTGLAFQRHHFNLDAGHGECGRARLDGDHVQPIGVADDGTAGFGLPPVVNHRHTVEQDMFLQPFPGGGVERFAGAHNALERRKVVAAGGTCAVGHEHTDRGGGGEDACDAKGFNQRAKHLRSGVIERPLIGDGGRSDHERGVHNVRMPHNPPDVRCRPPDIRRTQFEEPVACAQNPDAVAAVAMDGQFGACRCSRSRHDERGFVRFHGLNGAALLLATCEKFVPGEITPRLHRQIHARAVEHHHMLHLVLSKRQGVVHNAFERDIAPFAVGDIGGEHEFGAAGLNAAGERFRAEARKHHHVNRPDAYRCEHEHDGFGADGHVDGETVAFLHTHATQGGSDAFDVVQKVGVGEKALFAAFIRVDEGGVAAVSLFHMAVERVVAEVGFATDEPAIAFGVIPLEDLVPEAEPVETAGFLRPKVLRALAGGGHFAPNDGIDEINVLHGPAPLQACNQLLLGVGSPVVLLAKRGDTTIASNPHALNMPVDGCGACVCVVATYPFV